MRLFRPRLPQIGRARLSSARHVDLSSECGGSSSSSVLSSFSIWQAADFEDEDENEGNRVWFQSRRAEDRRALPLLVLGFSLLTSLAFAGGTGGPAIIPLPEKFECSAGTFELQAGGNGTAATAILAARGDWKVFGRPTPEVWWV